MTVTYQNDDPAFVNDLQESQRYVWITAMWLSRKGWTVQVPPLKVRPNVKERSQYADNGDLFVTKDNGLKRIEVKHRHTIDFTNAKDFPYKTLIVCEPYTWDRAKPFAYVIWDQDASHCAVVYSKTRHHWTIERHKDGRYQDERDYYVCPLEHCKFMER